MTTWLAIMLAATLPTANPVIELNPFPQVIESTRGDGFEITAETPIVLPGTADPQLAEAATRFARLSGLDMPVLGGGGIASPKNAIRIRIAPESFMHDGHTRSEAYRLDVDRNGVSLDASDVAGVRRGLFMLLQLDQVSQAVPFVTISDYPDIPVRGAMTDTLPSDEALADLAREGCNVVIMMTGFDAALPLRRAVNGARTQGIEPVAGYRLDATRAQSWPEAVKHLAGIAERHSLQHLYLRVTSDFVWHGVYRESGARNNTRERLRALTQAVSANTHLLIELPGSFRFDGNTLPPGAVAVVRDTNRLRGLPGRPYIVRASNTSAAYSAVETISQGVSSASSLALGVWVDYADGKARRWALGKAWNVDGMLDPWLHGLNDYFGSELFQPFPEEILDALVKRMNRQVLAGVEPDAEYKAFRSYLKAFRKEYPNKLDELDHWEDVYESLADYVELEARYRRKPHWTVLRNVVDVVQFMGNERWEWDAERTQYIVDVVEKQRLFVPSSILFGQYVVPQTERLLPEGARLLHIPVEPKYEAEKHRVQVRFDSPRPIAPVARVTFEAVDATNILLETSDDAEQWKTVNHVSREEAGGLRAPIEIDQPLFAPHFRVDANSPVGAIQLRNARLYGLKPPAEVEVPEFEKAPRLNGTTDDPAWRRDPDIFAFVTPRGDLHSDPVVGWVARNETGLWLAGRVEGWEADEALEIWLQPSGGDRFRTVLHPNTAPEIYESGLARAATEDAFEILIPWDVLGSESSRASWRADFRRVDSDGNVRSRWAESDLPDLGGRLQFR